MLIKEAIQDITQKSSTLGKQLKNIEVDIFNAASAGNNSVKTALLLDDVEFFQDVADELDSYGFDDLHFLSVDVDGETSAVLEIKW